jgi:hypothetical protein
MHSVWITLSCSSWLNSLSTWQRWYLLRWWSSAIKCDSLISHRTPSPCHKSYYSKHQLDPYLKMTQRQGYQLRKTSHKHQLVHWQTFAVTARKVFHPRKYLLQHCSNKYFQQKRRRQKNPHTDRYTQKGRHIRQNNNSASKYEVKTAKSYKGILLEAKSMTVTRIMNEQDVDDGVGLFYITGYA